MALLNKVALTLDRVVLTAERRNNYQCRFESRRSAFTLERKEAYGKVQIKPDSRERPANIGA